MRTLKNPLISGDSETHWVFSEIHDRVGNLFGYVYRFPKGFPKRFEFPGKRFLFRVYAYMVISVLGPRCCEFSRTTELNHLI
jgi:hypothetical protein